MKTYTPRGNALDSAAKSVVDTRKPLYIVQILDTSGSMDGSSTVVGDDGTAKQIKKIEQLNQGMKLVIKSLKEFEEASVMYKVYFQVIELNSYGTALFPEFVPVSKQLEEVKFEAEGCTCLGNSLSTLKTYISQKYMPGYNKALSVILMSDGWPTDVNGYVTDKKGYETVIDEFKSYLTEMDYARNVDLYSIAVGDDACEEMLKYFSGEERFFLVGESESIADKLDFVTRQTLAHHTTQSTAIYDEDDIEDDDLDDEDDAEAEDEGDGDEEEADFDDGEEEETDDDDSSDVLYAVDITKCKKERCKECIRKCPRQAIYINSGMVIIDQDKCNGCGKCVKECPYSAIVEDLGDDDLDSLLDD